MMSLPKNKSGFTLIEIMLAMTVFAIIMTTVLLAVENMAIARIKTENRVKLLEELYFFSEQLVGNVKEGGTIDYEEYWNRKSYSDEVGSGTVNIGQISGTYRFPTGVGNYGFGGDLATNYGNVVYYCTSENGPRMGTGGCLGGFNNDTGTSAGVSRSYTGTYQRYGQYALQFTDYNSNADGDEGDEDGANGILEDEDDKDIGNGPKVLSGSVPELYLINPTEKSRMYFRYVVRDDPGSTNPCTISSTGVTSDGCMGNIQILRMNGLDIGYGHSGVTTDFGVFDGKIDTWLLHPDWSGTGPTVPGGTLASGRDNEWIDLFPNSINVKSLQFHIFPEKDPWMSWDAQDCATGDPSCISPFIHPYVRIQMTVGFSWGKRRTLKNDDPTISVNTTVTLGDKE